MSGRPTVTIREGLPDFPHSNNACMAGKESFRFNSWFHLNTPTVIDFVNEHKSRELRLT